MSKEIRMTRPEESSGTHVHMTLQLPNVPDGSSDRKYDLEERTAAFGEAIIGFAKKIPIAKVTEPIIIQLVKSSTSIAANYCEGDDAGSRKEFLYRISIFKRESRECKYWLRMTATAALN